jgi:chromatin segregation and condensation protein Rec8/ScpA/Scc1 (kleisin family)
VSAVGRIEVEVELRDPKGFPGSEGFSGPLDLLLAIVRRNGYPLERLPLGEITRQFASYLQQSNGQMLDLGSDFFETSSWLVLLKSRALLPRTSESREAPPEEELRRVLLAHERIQEWSGLLGERLEQAGLGPGTRNESGLGESSSADPDTGLPPTVHDALASARRALAAARIYAEAETAEVAMTVEEALSTLAARLAALPPGRTASTEDWLGVMHSAPTRSAFLLALLELARLGEVWIFQPAAFAPVWVQRPALPSRNPRPAPG